VLLCSPACASNYSGVTLAFSDGGDSADSAATLPFSDGGDSAATLPFSDDESAAAW
jgi:hypothetical protein